MTLEYLELMEEIRKDQQQAQQQGQQEQPLPVPRRIRGTLTIKADDDMEFRAERKTGLSSQQEIAKTASGKLYRTTGEKRQSMVAHIVIPEGEKDATAFLYEQVERLTKGMQTKARPKLKGRTLLDEPNARITLSRKESRIEMVLGIDLKATPDYQTALMNLMYKVNQCFATNQNILVSARS